MATNEQIQAVRDAIEADAEEHGWNEIEITTRIDTGTRIERIIAAYWRRRASDVIGLVNTSEAGSSRGMDSVYPRYKTLADDWEKKADDLDREAEIDAQRRARNGTITRV